MKKPSGRKSGCPASFLEVAFLRFFHLADLHIGKRVNEFSMLEDQRFILHQILELADQNRPDAVLIAGDVYDKSIPPGEAVGVLDDFLTALSQRGISVFLIAGNHDSPERLGFGSRLLQKSGVHISSTYRGQLDRVILNDEYGLVNIWMLPFLKPAAMAPFCEERPETYQDAVALAMASVQPDFGERNILLAHQFVTSGGAQPERCESESVSIGGLDNVDSSVFDGYDYVALGHLHSPQQSGRDTVRYGGSPLKYSFSECRGSKSIVMADFGEKGVLHLEKLPLTPLRDLREIKGPIASLLDQSVSSLGNCEDYLHAILTDEAELADPIGKMRSVYPNIMRLDFENRKTAAGESRTAAAGDVSKREPLELFREFYRNQNNTELSPEEEKLMTELFQSVGERTE